MTNEQKVLFHNLFSGINMQIVAVQDFEEEGVDCDGETMYKEVSWFELWLDFKNNKQAGYDFIENITKEKIEATGLELYKHSLNKGLMKTLLDTKSKFFIRCKLD